MKKPFKKVIIWGYPLHSHTHSYIHAAFYKAFKHLGYETHWFDDVNHPQGFDYSNCLFICSSTGHEKYVTIDPTSTYVLHNVDGRRYLEAGAKVMFLQVYTTDIYKNNAPENLTKINDYTIFARYHDVNCLYMPWATDLLPHEVDMDKATNNLDKNGKIVWVGSLNGNAGDPYENASELNPFFYAAQREGIAIHTSSPWSTPLSFEENAELIRNSYLSPAINGKWQMEYHYLPCRLFKNISVGHFGITNNAFAAQIFGDSVIYDADTEALFYKAQDAKRYPAAIDYIKHTMDIVAGDHTYLNRINHILQALEM